MDKIDFSGVKFGKLSVVFEASPYIQQSGEVVRKFLCKCDCGKERYIRYDKLVSGLVKSCGCDIHRSEYDLSHEDFGIGYDENSSVFLFSKEDYDLIKKYEWYVNKKGYVETYDEKTHKNLLMHRLITKCPKDEIIDHINRNRMDNRRENLRICTYEENSKNRDIAKNNNSGITGVHFDKIAKKWAASIYIDKKYTVLGKYETKEEAKQARLKAELQYYRGFSPNNK